ncbi:hypothetical protein NSND_60050 [Nitrospira sp. ND1]|nr:hypothetical protein NSND_60050 [Nitrospira sp. ND1]
MLAERAHWEGARPTRAVEDPPAHPLLLSEVSKAERMWPVSLMKTRPAHRLAGVRKRDVPYSSRRAPRERAA